MARDWDPNGDFLSFSFSFNVYSINWEFWISYQYQYSQKDWENSRDWDVALWSWWWPFDLWLLLGPNSDLHRRRWALVAHMTWGQKCLQSQGTGQATKTDEFSEKFQMAVDTSPLIFGKLCSNFFRKSSEKKLYKGPKPATWFFPDPSPEEREFCLPRPRAPLQQSKWINCVCGKLHLFTKKVGG